MEGDKTKIGKKLLKMNIDATEQRYPENPYLTPKEKKERIKSFVFVPEQCGIIQAFKSIGCFSYQCSEGKIPKKKLYKQVQKWEFELAYKIINEMPKYQTAEWG